MFVCLMELRQMSQNVGLVQQMRGGEQDLVREPVTENQFRR